MPGEDLGALIDAQGALMIAIATGGPPIDSRQAEYVARRADIQSELRALRLDDPNPYRDLWAWYGYYSANLGTWRERRTYIGEMYEPLRVVLDERAEHALGTDLHPERTGWERVDDQLVQLRDRHASAATVEDYQAIGLLCRDVMVSLAEACHDPARHGASDGLVERLLAVVSDEAAGGSNQQLRAVFRSAIDLANKVQHDRRATHRSANVIAETTFAVVNLMRILVIDPT